MSTMVYLEDLAALENAFSHSNSSAVLIFKHSATWPVSSRAHREVGKFLDGKAAEKVTTCCIIVQNARDVSAQAADKTGIRHESPQVLLVKNGQCVWNASHRNITENALQDAVIKYA